MAGKVGGAVAGEEAGAVKHVTRNPGTPGQVDVEAEVQRVALVVVEEEIGAVLWRNEFGESAAHAAASFCILVRVGKVRFYPADLRRAQGRLPTAHAGAIDSQREEDVGIPQRVVIEVVFGKGVEVAAVDGPALEGDTDADFPLLVTFAAQGKKAHAIECGQAE